MDLVRTILLAMVILAVIAAFWWVPFTLALIAIVCLGVVAFEWRQRRRRRSPRGFSRDVVQPAPARDARDRLLICAKDGQSLYKGALGLYCLQCRETIPRHKTKLG